VADPRGTTVVVDRSISTKLDAKEPSTLPAILLPDGLAGNEESPPTGSTETKSKNELDSSARLRNAGSRYLQRKRLRVKIRN
jgi:hypothetical protein